MTEPARHISFATLDEYAAKAVPVTFPIQGDPDARLTVDAAHDLLRLEVAWDGEQPPDIGQYLHIFTGVHHHGGSNWSYLAVHGRRFFADAYPLLRSVADAVQLHRTSFSDAVQGSVRQYHDLLTSAGQMPANDEVGLYGELIVLRHVIGTLDGATALKSWRGGDQNAEHDFGFDTDDVEIKTTTADARRHWIGSLTQLEPTTGRNLWLVSVQLTAATGQPGTRLPELIADVTDKLPASARPAFETRIADTTYRPDQPVDGYRSLRLRSLPTVYRVDDHFPRLTTAALVAAKADVARIQEVAYTVHLDGLPTSTDSPSPLHGIDKKNG